MTNVIALALGAVGLLLLLASAVLRPRTRRGDVNPAELQAEARTAAIRIYRERTGADLLEARDAVDRIRRGSKSS